MAPLAAAVANTRGRKQRMSDFTDAADRQLVQLAAEFATSGRQIHWGNLAARMKRCTHSKEALQQRLKTLKRTHGTDVRAFPPCSNYRESSPTSSPLELLANVAAKEARHRPLPSL
ncbi:hypothetical protein PybrP1_011922 [[Pythium] brassicae (nom. inval.)]|nr:hypothetical protein PybrP1_011922 [[Pythium] brassicae (nom. inval.)]